MLCLSKESRISRVSSIQYKRGPEQAIKLHLCELEYWAICFSGSRLSHQCNHHTFVGVTCHWIFIFPAQEPEQFVLIVDNKTQQKKLTGRNLYGLQKLTKLFTSLLFRKLFRQMLSSEEDEKSGRKRREEGRGQSRRHQRHMSGKIHFHEVNLDAFC